MGQVKDGAFLFDIGLRKHVGMFDVELFHGECAVERSMDFL
ncbi:MAG: hypothetical protein RSC18_03080 [Raoultibacter sp.]